jgi:hypothetical protein
LLVFLHFVLHPSLLDSGSTFYLDARESSLCTICLASSFDCLIQILY